MNSEEVAVSKKTQKSEGRVGCLTKKDSRRSNVSRDRRTPPVDSCTHQLHTRGMTSQSIHSSTPYSTPPIDSCSLEDVTLCGQQSVLFTPSVLVSALSNSFRRSQSVGFDPLETSGLRKSVTFSESTYSSASGTVVSRARRASTALPEESLSSASSDDVFMSATGSRECSTSPCEAQPVTREIRGLPIVNIAKEQQNTDVGSDVYYSIYGSDSGSEPLGGGNILTWSNGSHCISDLCSDDDENAVCYSSKSDKRFHSPVGYYSAKLRRRFRTSEDEARSAFTMNHSDCSNTSANSDNSRFARVFGDDNTRCCDTDCDTGREYRPSKRSDADCDTGLEYRPSKRSDSDHDTGLEYQLSKRSDTNWDIYTATALYAENIDAIAIRNETNRVSTELHEPARDINPQSTKYDDVCVEKCSVLGSIRQSPVQKSRQSSCLPDEDTATDLFCAISAIDCQKKCINGPVERLKGFEGGGCEEWRFIDEIDDDVFNDQPSAGVNQQNHKVVAQSKLTSHSMGNSSLIAEGMSGSPFLSPPNSPTLLEAVTSVWMKEFGAKNDESVEVDHASKTRRVDSDTIKCQQQTKLIADTAQCLAESHHVTQRSRSSGSLFSHRLATDQVERNIQVPSLVLSVNCESAVCQQNVSNNSNKDPELSSSVKSAVCQQIVSNNSNKDPELGSSVKSGDVFELVNDLINHKEQYKTTSGTTCESAEHFSHISFRNAISSVPDVIRDATNSCGTSGVSLRKKSVKELKSRFEQNIANEMLEVTKASQSRKTPLPRYSRSQSYHGFQTSEANSVFSSDCNDRYSLSKFGRSVGVLTVDVVQCTNDNRNEVVSSAARIICNDKQQVDTDMNEGVFKSVDDELLFMTRYAVPSVSARISCFEPLLSASRLSPEFRTTPENKRARLSSCGSSVAINANRQNVTVLDNNIMFVNTTGDLCSVTTNCTKTELENHCTSRASGCDLVSLLDIPALAAIALPKVSERKRLFEAESAKLLNSQSPGVRHSTSSYSEDTEPNQKSPSNKEDKENSCAVLGRSTSRKKLFGGFEPSDDAFGLLEKSGSATKNKPINVNDSMEPLLTGATSSQQHSKWSVLHVVPT